MKTTDQEFIEKQNKSLAAYNAATERMNKEIETILDGKPETYVKENGMPGFHDRIEEIKKIRYTLADVAHRKLICEKTIAEVMEG